MFEALIPCLAGIQVSPSDSIRQGFWIATGPDGVRDAGRLNMINIPKGADTIHLNVEDSQALKAELERIPQ